MRLGVIVGLLGMLALACWLSYRIGIAEADAEMQKALKAIENQSILERSKQETKINEIESRYIKKVAESDKRIRELGLKLKARETTGVCTNELIGHRLDVVPDDIIGVLSEAVRDPHLPEADLSTRDINPEEATIINLSKYTLYAIGEYNSCATQVNALIESVK